MDQSVRNLLNKKMKLGGQELNVSDVVLLGGNYGTGCVGAHSRPFFCGPGLDRLLEPVA